ncbi:MAG: helix-turn-helix transcriptional regulator [Lewinellaceae bacterium]|nr:helix-turn-helix transcriptional regulator [Lewinellaceae bacterium]
MSVKERVEFLLKQTNLSQSEFASKSGYSRAVLSNFLTGKTDKPRIDLLEAIKKYFLHSTSTGSSPARAKYGTAHRPRD